jgi:hypothetical protein
MFSSNTSQVSSAGGYEIQRSLRFNSADSAYLNRTPASAGNRQVFTWSAWIKIGRFKSDSAFISAGSNIAAWAYINFQADAISIYETNSGVSYNLTTTQVFRDPSAWYHLVVAFDTTQATASNRIKLYVNGSQVTSFATASYPSQNFNTWYNSATPQGIGRLFDGGSGYYFDGYQTEIYMIDGQALTPSSFGAFDAQTGVWGPTRYAGSYGTNGFYLNFSDNSNTTAATLGRDYSGNSNNWTPNNFSVSAGAGNDSLVDVPTNWGADTGVGGSVRGNYCTFNPLIARWDVNTGALSNGNLEAFDTVGDANNPYFFGTLSVSSGKFYWEITVTAIGTSAAGFFIGVDSGKSQTVNLVDLVTYASDGQKYVGGPASSYGATYTTGDVIGVALDKDANTVTFYKNNASQGAISLPTNVPMVAWISPGSNSGYATANFGQRPFAYTAPSGFKALNTQNLPTPTIGATTATQAGKFFNPVLYTGNGFPTSGTQSVSGVGFQPDWVWIKSRSAAGSNTVTDVVRGINSQLFTNTTGAQETNTDNITALNSDGFSLGSNTTGSTSVNVNGQTYVAWNWKANGTGVTNTAGSITSTVSANTTSGFSIATFTGNGIAGATFGHGLGVAPRMIIIKSIGNARNWLVYHVSIGATKFLQLDTAIEALTGITPWNNTEPTSSVVTLGTSAAGNESGVTRVAYCFAEVPGYSSFGSYTGNGSTDGPFVFTGMRPAFIMTKRTDVAGLWWEMVDMDRSPTNVSNKTLYANVSDAEYTNAAYDKDLLSNGFKMRGTNGGQNASGGTYIFMAFAENPFKYSLAR